MTSNYNARSENSPLLGCLPLARHPDEILKGVEDPTSTSFKGLLGSLSPDPLTRGKQFERLVKWWLTQDPIWSRKITNVWLWDEWPEYPGRDIGIDLVLTLISMAPSAGIEPATCGLEVRCSIRLSYEGIEHNSTEARRAEACVGTRVH